MSEQLRLDPRFAGVRIHISSYLDEDVAIGEGTTIWHFCHILPGAVIGKHLKRGQVSLIPVLARLAARWVMGTSPIATSFGGRATPLRRLRSFWSGLIAGVAWPVDRETRHFLPGKGESHREAAGLGRHSHA